MALVASQVANGKDAVRVSFTLQDSRVTLQEPVFVNLTVRNELSEEISFDLGFDRKEGLRFSVTQPDGYTLHLPRYHRGGIGQGGRVTLKPDERYQQSVLLNELYQIAKPGEYAISATLAVPIHTQSGMTVALGPPEKMRLTVAERDPKRLGEVCQRLAKMATGADYETARNGAFALRYVEDPVAVPYLGRLISEGDPGVKPLAVTGLARIGTPEAVRILTLHLNTTDPGLKAQIESALWEIRTGRKLEVYD